MSEALHSAGKPAGSIRIAATDGYALSARVYGASSNAAAGNGPVVVINGATGVRQKYYARFAEWLVHRGATVVSWDYRGIGESRPHRLRGFTGTMSDWGKHDFEGVLRFVSEKFSGRELVVIGHSIGGQILGQARSNRNIARAVTVGSQFGSWQLWPGYKKWAMAGLWHVLMPGITHVMGRFPGSLGIGADLPRNVALEWAKWGRSRDFFLAHGVSRDGYAAVDAPILSFSLTDDDYAPRPAVDALHALYVNASVERRHVSPQDVGVSSIGHFGFFRDQFAPTLWEQVRAFVFSSQPASSALASASSQGAQAQTPGSQPRA